MHTPAPIPLAMGTTTSPTPVTLNVIHVEETPKNKTINTLNITVHNFICSRLLFVLFGFMILNLFEIFIF